MTSLISMNRSPGGDQSSPQISEETSAGVLSKDDRDGTSDSMSKCIGYLLQKLMPGCSPGRMDLNPVRMVLAELAGTFILMFCIFGIIAITQLLKGQVGLLEYSATAGLTVVIVIFAIGHISGAHVNPAVTIAFAIFSDFPWSRVPLYIIAQLTGSSLATLVGSAVYGVESNVMTTRPIKGSSSAFWVELLAMFIVVFPVASISYNHKSVGHLSGFVVGIAIALAVLITTPVSGGSLNPARSLGPAIVSWEFDYIWIYMTAPVIGSIAGALLYRIVRLQREPCTATSNSSSRAGLLGYP